MKRIALLRKQLAGALEDVDESSGIARVQTRKLVLSISAELEDLLQEQRQKREAKKAQALASSDVVEALCAEIARMPHAHLEAIYDTASRALGLSTAAPALKVVG
jgi:hypothetical protein